jgi:hypothetical protein
LKTCRFPLAYAGAGRRHQHFPSSPLNQQNKNIMKNQTPTSTSNSQPVHKIRHGAVSASIWRQETDKGPLFNVTFQRSYKDGDTWKNSTSFGRNNLLVVSLIAARAFEWIGNQPRQPKR